MEHVHVLMRAGHRLASLTGYLPMFEGAMPAPGLPDASRKRKPEAPWSFRLSNIPTPPMWVLTHMLVEANTRRQPACGRVLFGVTGWLLLAYALVFFCVAIGSLFLQFQKCMEFAGHTPNQTL